jgi:light-regulated signal transduction histidine kinase (bacteriophytochrome)
MKNSGTKPGRSETNRGETAPGLARPGSDSRSKDEMLRSGKVVILLSMIAGMVTWILNAIVERLYYFGPTRNFWDLLLFEIPPEEFYDRIIAVAAFLLLGIIVARMLEKQIASEKRLKLLAAELERSNRELEQFAYMASHDLKEPLVTAGGYLRLLERRHQEALDGNATGCLRNALKGIERMERLIGDLLNYSRAGNHETDLRPVDPSAILDTVLANLSGVIEKRNAVVTRDPLHEVLADDTQLLQLFQNLVSNGIKFCRDPSPRIHVTAFRNENETVFSVRDNGIGIEQEHIEEIFQVFRRLHNRKEFPGTGIGLATCKKIVEWHGGRIWVESRPGEGATFLFTLPNVGIPPRNAGTVRKGTSAAA